MYPLKTKIPYNPDSLSSTGNIYTTVYLGNYIPGDFNEGSGSHLGVDIIPQSKYDHIFACLDGIIHFAGTNDSNGNYVVIRHDNAPDPDNLSHKTTLYSCHLHLSELNVKTGDMIAEGAVIGRSGNTGNSTGEHLHFQIDRSNAPFHPYWPFTMAEARESGLGFFEAVNRGLGLDNARKYSINPLVYLDKVASSRGSDAISRMETVKSEPITAFATKSRYFKDVTDDVEEIDFLAEKGISKGNGGYFLPKANITRAELLAMTYKFAGLETTGSGKDFKDVLPTDWYAPFVANATARGFISGYDDGTFRPNNAITRAEAAAIILNVTVGKNNIPSAADTSYQDVSVNDWYCRYANYVSENGLIDSIGRFYPNDNMKRSDFAVMLYNLKDKI